MEFIHILAVKNVIFSPISDNLLSMQWFHPGISTDSIGRTAEILENSAWCPHTLTECILIGRSYELLGHQVWCGQKEKGSFICSKWLVWTYCKQKSYCVAIHSFWVCGLSCYHGFWLCWMRKIMRLTGFARKMVFNFSNWSQTEKRGTCRFKAHSE